MVDHGDIGRLSQDPPDLECEEGVASAGDVDTVQRWTGEGQPDALVQEPMHCTKAQRFQRQAMHRLRLHAVEPERQLACFVRPSRQQECRRIVVEPPSDKRQDICRRTVEPVNVVDRDEQRSACGEGVHGCEDADCNSAVLCARCLGFLEQKRDCEAHDAEGEEGSSAISSKGSASRSRTAVNEIVASDRDRCAAQDVDTAVSCSSDTGAP